MEGWAICPSCQLKHRRRPEGTCPRCASSVDAAPADFTAPAASEAYPYAGAVPVTGGGMTYAAGELSATEEEGGPGLRLAGAVLLLNALLVITERAMVPQLGGSPLGAGIASIVIDAGLGVSLLSGSARYRTFAAVRGVLGLLFFTGLRLLQGETASAVLQLVFSSSLLMLLLGTPSMLRRGVALAGVGLCMLLQVVGLYALHTGTQVFGGLLMADASEPGAVEDGGVVRGRNFPFVLRLPSESWLVRKTEDATQDNPLVDRWFIHPRSGVHLLVIGEELPPGSQLNMDIFGQNVIDNLRKGAKVHEVSSPSCGNSDGMPTCTIRGSGSANMMAVEYEVSLFATPSAAYQLIAFGPTDAFSELRQEVRDLASSFAAN